MMVSRLLIGDNNLTRYWPAYQFGRPALKGATLVTSTDLDMFDGALSQIEDKDQVVISMLTSVLLDEVNTLEVASSSSNIFTELLSRLVGFCPQSPSCQVGSKFFVFRGSIGFFFFFFFDLIVSSRSFC